MAATQVRYQSARVLHPLEREIMLAQQMAASHTLKRWALAPDDPQLQENAMREIDSFRDSFRDKNCYIALREAAIFYHSRSTKGYGTSDATFQLNPKNDRHQWFYDFLGSEEQYRLRVDKQRLSGAPRLWVDVLVRQDSQVLGVVGTGLELEKFLDNRAEDNQPGVSSMLVDYQGQILLYRGNAESRQTGVNIDAGVDNMFYQLLDSSSERREIRSIMRSLKNGPGNERNVETGFFYMNGKRHLLGMTYLSSIGWYDITLIDLEALMPISRFIPALFAFGSILFLCLLMFHQALRGWILNPIDALETAMKRVRDGDLSEPDLPKGRGEIRELIEHFSSMSTAIRSHTQDLEEEVRGRTLALHKLARVDPLTELTNRRGMNEIIRDTLQRSNREGQTFAIIWLDLDYFKELNDKLGHATGDDALKLVAHVLKENLRPYDSAARWGGDEFLVLLSPCDQVTLLSIGERIRAHLADTFELEGWPTTASLGGYLAQPGDTKDVILQNADEAMYRAKMAGRNRFRLAKSDIVL